MIRDSFDIRSNDNALFVTSQCNNHCLMCCQPPSEIDDIEYLFKKNCSIIDNAEDLGLPQIAITGGEPTLLGQRLFILIQYIQEKFPETCVHLLSNGRRFADNRYTGLFEAVNKDNLLVGIPLHSDYAGDHDYITQVSGSFAETVIGLHQLAAEDIDIELRILIHKMNWKRLDKIADFIYKNLPFVNFVAFMGMEYTGCSIKNHGMLWVDPYTYRFELEKAVTRLSRWGIPVAIYNLPHCILTQALYPYAERSISDWKTIFLNCCDSCNMKEKCSGLFSTSRWQSEHLKPITSAIS